MRPKYRMLRRIAGSPNCPLIESSMRGEIADMHRQLWCLTVLIWIGHSSAIADPMPTASSSTTPAVEQVEAGTPGRTPAGTTFTVPAGWSMSASGQVVVLSPPEPDLRHGALECAGH
jgi:hypothetical protein